MQDTFEGGVTNGNDWYPVFGGMQDWLYVQAGTLEVTLELSPKKWPQGAALARVCEDSKPALLAYPLRAALCGVHGRVTARGAPAGALRIYVFGRVHSDYTALGAPAGALDDLHLALLHYPLRAALGGVHGRVMAPGAPAGASCTLYRSLWQCLLRAQRYQQVHPAQHPSSSWQA
jgi:Zinc carboxypeptidase